METSDVDCLQPSVVKSVAPPTCPTKSVSHFLCSPKTYPTKNVSRFPATGLAMASLLSQENKKQPKKRVEDRPEITQCAKQFPETEENNKQNTASTTL
jgi:hypothetical protein